MKNSKRFNFFVASFLIFTIALSINISSINLVNAETASEREARLKAELAQIEKEQKQVEKIVTDTKAQGASISRDIALLDAQIKSAQLKIKAKNIIIEQLGKDIASKNKIIGSLEDRIEEGQKTLAELLSRIDQYQRHSESEILMSNSSFSEFLLDVDQYEQVQDSIYDLFVQIRDDKKETEDQKTVLDSRKNSEQDAMAEIQAQKRIVEAKQKEKDQLLKLNKNQQTAYEQLLAQKRAKAAEIRAALFSLRDSDAIPFGKAYEYAVKASQTTGIRPAFLLAILTQESALGKNVGSCYLADPQTGAGVSTKTGVSIEKVMSPARDVTPFITITKNLGRDPYKTLVSCPIPSAGGWGGAMGPAQFIPSTWTLFESRIEKALSVANADPWRAEDAFLASAMYLTDRGAAAGTYTAEINAACKYYTGRSCAETNSGYTYGGQVMMRAQNIQDNMINLILNN